MLAFCQWLQQNSFVMAMGQSISLAVVCEVLHYFTLFVLVGGAAIIDLRLLNLGFRSQSLTKLGLRAFPWIWLAFLLNFVTGFGLLMSEAVEYYYNVPFRVTMLVVLLAVIVTLIIQSSIAKWDQANIPFLAKVTAVASILLWVGSILASVEVPFLTNIG
jgi:hypothetical protein